MWDNARFLNAVADVLYLVAAALALWAVAQAAVRVPFAPVRTVSVAGSPAHVDAEAVSAALDGRIAGNFFGLELADVRRELGEAALGAPRGGTTGVARPHRGAVRGAPRARPLVGPLVGRPSRQHATASSSTPSRTSGCRSSPARPGPSARSRAATSRSASSSHRSVRSRRT